jgi:hypothetical protein
VDGLFDSEGLPTGEDTIGDVGDLVEVEVFVGDPSLFLHLMHDRVMEVLHRREMPIYGALSYACPFGDGSERERRPVPTGQLVGKLAPSRPARRPMGTFLPTNAFFVPGNFAGTTPSGSDLAHKQGGLLAVSDEDHPLV